MGIDVLIVPDARGTISRIMSISRVIASAVIIVKGGVGMVGIN
jgi:hypothetical protein